MILSNRQSGNVSVLNQMIHQNSLVGKFEAFLLSCRVDDLSPATLRDYRQKIGAFITYCTAAGVNDPGQVTASHVRMFLLNLQDTCNRTSIRDYYRCCKRFFNWMVTETVIAVSSMLTIRPPRDEKKIIQPFNTEQIKSLLEISRHQSNFLAARDQAIILTFIDTGLRLSEMAGIQLMDVNIDNETIKVMGKGAKERIVRVGKTAQRAILKYLLLRTDNLPCLWITQQGRPLTKEGLVMIIRRLSARAGIQGQGVRCSAHTFRHTFATQALLNGAGEREVQSLLGHSTLTMTMRYVATINSNTAVQGHKRFSPVDRMMGKK